MFSKADSRSFLYFAYGSNLLTERIRINNPSARKITNAKLKDFRLDFNLYGSSWHGATATIIPETDGIVWGVVWEIDNIDLENLDRQELGYDPVTVTVETTDNRLLECRSYLVCAPLAGDRRPSAIYKNVIVKGAMEHKLPDTYVESLQRIVDNDYRGPVGIELSTETLRNG